MAASLNRGSRRHGRGGHIYRPMADINITPLVDVMLVLLVIFMVTAPLVTVGVPVDLPKTKAQSIDEPDEPLVVSITAEGTVFLQETEIALDALAPRLAAIAANRAETRIFVRGDQSVNYGRVMEVMSTINAAGFRKVALITESKGQDDKKDDKKDKDNGERERAPR